MAPFRVLSWGCGVQSTTLAVMSALGNLEPLDAVISSDTMWERQRTYEMRDFYAAWLRERGVRVEVMSGGDIRRQGAKEHIHIPFWTGNGGPLRRQCTRHFKVTPVKRRIRELMGYHPSEPPHPPAGAVEQWIGFSLDEWHRMSNSRAQFIIKRYPLIEHKMTRNDCVDFLQSHSLPVPPKSACIGCPFRSASEWLEVQRDSLVEWTEAIYFDEANRHNPLAKRHGGNSTANELFIYKNGPLVSADLEADALRERQGKQLPLMICNEGSCWT